MWIDMGVRVDDGDIVKFYKNAIPKFLGHDWFTQKTRALKKDDGGTVSAESLADVALGLRECKRNSPPDLRQGTTGNR